MTTSSGASSKFAGAVEPGPPLHRDRVERYSRQLLLPGFGELAQRRLANARVLVIGAGGLGSASIPYLASSGVGTIGVIDSDVVELSNLHRQVSHGIGDIGRSKVASIVDTVAAIDPQIVVVPHSVRLTADNALSLFANYDVVLDGSDNFPTRYLTNDAAALSAIPLVWGAIFRYSGQLGVAWAAQGPNYRDLFPVPPAPDQATSCAVGGVLPSVCATIGALMSAEAIKVITGVGEPLVGRVNSFDAITGRFRELRYGPSPDALPITGLIDYQQFCGLPSGESSPELVRAENSGHSAATPTVNVQRLAERMAANETLQLIDVREPAEADIARITGAELIPLGTLVDAIEQIRTDVPVIIHCHHDGRAHSAAARLRERGLHNIEVLEGGIDAYAALVDHTLARY